MKREFDLREHVPLAPFTTLELGGEARYFVEAREEATVISALEWAADAGVPAVILGGGSNLLVADEGYPGLVIRIASRGIDIESAGDRSSLHAMAGEPWDELVARSVEANLAGLECLSGIPGLAGATPIQNVGAYGVEIAEHLATVRTYDRRTRRIVVLSASDCAFAYRDSMFKRDPARFVVLEVSFRLTPGGSPTLRYPELVRALEGGAASLPEVRRTVLELRRRKSMVLDPADENRRSAGSFFLNPIVSKQEAERVFERAVELGLVASASEVPRYDGGEGRVKLAAGWLIERSGIEKGLREGAVGVSSRHALSLVHHGGGTTRALLALAERIAEAVRTTFGVAIEREPVLLAPETVSAP